jgi:hypothetical protein
MSKEDHTKLFIIEVYVIVEGASELSKHFLDVGFSTSNNYIHGSKNDIEEDMGHDYGSFGLPLFVKKTDDRMSSSLLTINTIFTF